MPMLPGFIVLLRIVEKMGSEAADKVCIGLLIPERLKDQFCFRSERALSKLKFLKSEKVALE